MLKHKRDVGDPKSWARRMKSKAAKMGQAVDHGRDCEVESTQLLWGPSISSNILVHKVSSRLSPCHQTHQTANISRIAWKFLW